MLTRRDINDQHHEREDKWIQEHKTRQREERVEDRSRNTHKIMNEKNR